MLGDKVIPQWMLYLINGDVKLFQFVINDMYAIKLIKMHTSIDVISLKFFVFGIPRHRIPC